MGALQLQRIRDTEREIQRVFDTWPFDVSPSRQFRAGAREYTVVGCPDWLTPRGRSSLPKTLASPQGYDFRPDVVWDGENETFVLELKSAVKYEPIALPEVLHHAHRVAEAMASVGDGKPPRVVPVMVTQYSAWLRESLAYLFGHGLAADAIRYLEFDVLRVPTQDAEGAVDRRILWLDEPFSSWSPTRPPSELLAVLAELTPVIGTDKDHWYKVDATGTWVVTEQEQGTRRPLFIQGRYVMIAAPDPTSIVCWSGSQLEAGTYQLLSRPSSPRPVRVSSPRLAHPEQIVDFQMIVESDPSGHA